MTRKTHIGIILLAAGNSSRMGRNKLKYVHQGKTILENVVNEALDSMVQKTLVVLGAYEEENRQLISSRNVESVFNKNWQDGIGNSIKFGLKEIIKKEAELNAVIISVCDQPYLTKEVFDGLINTYKITGKKIIASVYNNSYGVPVLYDKILFNELLNIPDEHGAKRYIIKKAKKEMLGSVSFPKGEIDIDTIEDLQKIYPALKDVETEN